MGMGGGMLSLRFWRRRRVGMNRWWIGEVAVVGLWLWLEVMGDKRRGEERSGVARVFFWFFNFDYYDSCNIWKSL